MTESSTEKVAQTAMPGNTDDYVHDTYPKALDAPTMPPDASLSGFLRDILHDVPQPSADLQQQSYGQGMSGTLSPRNVLDFGRVMDLGFAGIDLDGFGDWETWFEPEAAVQDIASSDCNTDHSTPTLRDSIGMGSAAFKRSPWRWMPTTMDKGVQVPYGLAETATFRHRLASAVSRSGDLVTDKMRDRMSAVLLRICDHANSNRLIQAFPSTAILNTLVMDFLDDHQGRLDSYIHTPSLSIAAAKPELLILMAAAGAVLSPIEEIQRFGYALHELSRIGLPQTFEADHSESRSLQPMQLFALLLDIGIWSGDKRTIELTECQALPLVTMLRRSDHFRCHDEANPMPLPTDSADLLDVKWQAWVKAESFKRLAYHVFIYCGQTSIALQVPPLVSYAEVMLELPSHRTLWAARSAQEWYTQWSLYTPSHPPSGFAECLWNVEHTNVVRKTIDIGLSLYAIIMGHWGLVWEYLKLDSTVTAETTHGSTWSPALLASYKRQELRNLLDHFQLVIDEWQMPLPPEVPLVAELLRLNLYVPFDELQRLAGKEGEERARRALPSLKNWQQSADARRVMWHAAQMLRIAKCAVAESMREDGTTEFVREFNAVAIYHAGVALWVYGLLAQAADADSKGNVPNPDTALKHSTFALDASSNILQDDIQRFIALNRGVPALTWDFPHPHASASSQLSDTLNDSFTVYLHDPKTVMQIVIGIMNGNRHMDNMPTQHTTGSPAITRNLIQLLNDLGNAASAI